MGATPGSVGCGHARQLHASLGVEQLATQFPPTLEAELVPAPGQRDKAGNAEAARDPVARIVFQGQPATPRTCLHSGSTGLPRGLHGGRGRGKRGGAARLLIPVRERSTAWVPSAVPLHATPRSTDCSEPPRVRAVGERVGAVEGLPDGPVHTQRQSVGGGDSLAHTHTSRRRRGHTTFRAFRERSSIVSRGMGPTQTRHKEGSTMWRAGSPSRAKPVGTVLRTRRGVGGFFCR